MPAEAWYLLIAAVLVAVIAAVWKGAGLTLSKDKDGVQIAVKERAAPPSAPRHIEVANGATIKGGKTGDIAGVLVRGSGAAPVLEANVEVLGKGRLEGAEVGDIAGVKRDDAERKNG
jgi:hypothetical protein